MRRFIWLVLGTLAMSFAAPVHASELPTTFLGSWTNNDMGDVEITGIHAGGAHVP